MDLKIDSRARPVTLRDQEVIAAIRTQAAETKLFVLSEVALGYLKRKTEAIKITMAMQKANGGVRFRSATLPTCEHINTILKLVDEYAQAGSPVENGISAAMESDLGPLRDPIYTVKAGDSLSKIAQDFYGGARDIKVGQNWPSRQKRSTAK